MSISLTRFIFFKVLLITFSFTISKPQYPFAICAIFQQEARYLKEWIEFHKLIGAKHFYLYNNFSYDNYKDILFPYIEKKEVELIDWPIHANPKDATWVISAYNDALIRAKNETEWLAFLDIDEFLFPVQTNNLLKILKDYKRFGSLQVNWVMFGTSNIKKIEHNELSIEKLILRAPINHKENLHTKMIVQPKLVTKILTQHCAQFLPNYFQVNSDKIKFEGPFSPNVLINKIRINHYWSREEDFLVNVKVPRRLLDMGEEPHVCLARNMAINKEFDNSIFKYIPKLKKNMGFTE